MQRVGEPQELEGAEKVDQRYNEPQDDARAYMPVNNDNIDENNENAPYARALRPKIILNQLIHDTIYN